MKNNTAVIDNDIKDILFSDEYWRILGRMGFSKDFVLNERIRKQKECIDYLIKQNEPAKKSR